MNDQQIIQRFIAHHGGQRRLAAALGLSHGAVHQWLLRGVSRDGRAMLRELGGRIGVAVPAAWKAGKGEKQ